MGGTKAAVVDKVSATASNVAQTEAWKTVAPVAEHVAKTAAVVTSDIKEVVLEPMLETVKPMPAKIKQRVLRGSVNTAVNDDAAFNPIDSGEYLTFFIIITALCWMALLWLSRFMMYSLCCLLCCRRRRNKQAAATKDIEMPNVCRAQGRA